MHIESITDVLLSCRKPEHFASEFWKGWCLENITFPLQGVVRSGSSQPYLQHLLWDHWEGLFITSPYLTSYQFTHSCQCIEVNGCNKGH